MNSFYVREATPEDAEIIGRINVETWVATYRGVVHQSFLDSLDPAEMAGYAAKRIANSNLNCFVLCEKDGGRVTGYAHIGPCREKNVDADGELYAIYILPAFQNKGAGKTLLDAAIAKCRRRGFLRVMVSVFEQNISSRKFYEKSGATFIGSDHVDIENHRYPTATYLWELATR